MSTESPVPDPQGRFLGMPYDFRMPTFSRVRARFWNPDDDRLFTPMVFGWGYAINFRTIGSLVR